MKCEQVRLQLPEIARPGTEGLRDRLLRDHLAQCPSCSAELERLKELMSGLAQLPAAAPSSTYWATLLPNIHRRIEQRSASQLPAWVSRFLLPGAAALVIIVFVLNGGVLMQRGGDSDLAAVISRLSGEEIQQVTDQSTLTNDFISSTWDEPAIESSDDVDVLQQLLASENQSAVYRDLDVDDAVSTLNDQEVAELVSTLQQKSVAN